MSSMNMDELVKKLQADPKARQEWLEIAKRVENTTKPKEGDAPLTVKVRHTDTDACRLSYEDGFSLCFTCDGGMFLESDETGEAKVSKSVKTIREEQPSAFEAFMKGHTINLEDMMFVVTHTGYMFSREAVKAFDRHKDVVAKAEQKTRYMAVGNKRAFMAGLVCGRKPQ